jgi:oxygen-independent coproporphyrinogen-3 oxidase
MIPIKPVSQLTGIVRPTTDISQIPQDVATKFLSPGSLNLSVLPPLSLYIHFPGASENALTVILIRMK